MQVIWNKVTEVLPPEGRDLLVWTGQYMIVSDAYYFILSNYQDADRVRLTKIKGKFQEFGRNYYFDNPKVFWAELPKPPEA